MPNQIDVLVLICTQSFTGEDLVEDVLLDPLLEMTPNIQVALVDEAGIDWSLTTNELEQQQPQKQEQQAINNIYTMAKVVLVVASTYADGDPPNHAVEFAHWLARERTQQKQQRQQESSLVFPYFAVFGLGDRSYDHYCAFAEYIDEHIAALLGGKQQRLISLRTGDALQDQSGQFGMWVDDVLLLVKQQELLPQDGHVEGDPTQQEHHAQQTSFFKSTGGDWRRSILPTDSGMATLESTLELLNRNGHNGDDMNNTATVIKSEDQRSVLHVSLNVPTHLCPKDDPLEPGDYVSIYPHNEPSLVRRTLEWLNLNDAHHQQKRTTTILVPQPNNNQNIHHQWIEQSISVHDFLQQHVDLVGRASASVLRALLPFVGTLELRALARDLTAIETVKSNTTTTTSTNNATSTSSLFDQWLGGRRMTKLDLLQVFECRPSLQALARAFGPIQPRLYSIATVHPTTTTATTTTTTSHASTANTTTIGLCMAIVSGGLCTNYMAELEPGQHVRISFKTTNFHMVHDDGSPALLIAAGSGIGPYIGFLEQQQQQQPSLSNTRLFFGCRTPADVLYQETLTEFQQHHGVQLNFAYSRLFGHPRLHAQDLVTREQQTVWKDIFQDQGRVFICGRLELCTDVHKALVQVARTVGRLGERDAVEAVQQIEREGRLFTDCWSVDETSVSEEAMDIPPPDIPHVISQIGRHYYAPATAVDTCSNKSEVDLSAVPEWPSYLRLLESGELERRIQRAEDMQSACVACGRFCEVNRLSSNPEDWGECRVGEQAIVFDAAPHFGEEDCLKGTNGSGTIFFGACNLKCVYCQNWEISVMDKGWLQSDEQLADLMMLLQRKGCHNINLVSPTHNVLAILRSVYIAAKKGLKLPIVWNTGGYDSVASLRLLEGIIDIYMPDSKYASRVVARKLSKVDNYPEINQAAIKEMYRQVGDLQIDPRTGLAFRGVLVRHLVLPSDLAGTNDVASFLANEISTGTYMNVMPQYRPEHKASEDQKFGLARKPTANELLMAYQGARRACLRRLHGEDEQDACIDIEECDACPL